MKEINIAKMISEKRKEKRLTQDELANYIGVSKASVSKWETGQSYPDIAFLPQLATYFNVSIDELMGYSPQMSKEDIRELYIKLSSDFVSKPFDEVMEDCNDIIKKYYSCFPLLLQMSGLLMNHHMLAPNKTQQTDILNQAVELCQRVVKESDDIRLSKNALIAETACYQMLGKPEAILDLLGEEIYPISQDTEAIALAHQQLGNIPKARETMQVAMYQHLIYFMGNAYQSITLYADNIEKVDVILERAIGVGDLFNIDYLHPNTMAVLYLISAQTYCMAGQTQKAIELLERYAKVCITDLFPCTLHGDSFFDMMNNWFVEFDIGNTALRNDEAIKKDVIKSVEENPAFLGLADDPRYQNIIKSLKLNLGG